ncbi:carboxylesterase family protein [Acidovorax sp. NCPPB 2350]|nr:carboxylesterase family protein [Acidovorax sp. NCPPB 2350]
MTAGRGAPHVTLPHGGRLRGAWADGVRVFRGVRYARPPFGALRFEPPAAEPPWHGVRDATRFGPAFLQWPRAAGADAAPSGAEDALTLNVWAPDAPLDARLPVMVWVHGGGFIRGAASDPLYDGASFARQGLVFVSIQYRLGVDGFALLPDAPANRGLLDQLEALRWVRDCIAAWGGDPGRVTVFGQSAGAGALACLMGMPASHGLFHRAALQSPSMACQTREEARVALGAIAALAGVAATRAALAAAPVAGLLRAVHRLAAEPALRRSHGMDSRHFFPLRPVVDGSCLAVDPLEAIARAWQARGTPLQVLVGHNAEEMRLYHVPGGGLERLTQDDLDGFLRDADLPAPPPGGTPGERLCALQSRYYYGAPAQRLAELAGLHARSSHRYLFTWPSPQCAGRLGAAHGIDLPFVFDTLGSPTGQELAGPAPPRDLARRMHAAWTRFARDGDPGWPRHAGPAPWTEVFGAPAD